MRIFSLIIVIKWEVDTLLCRLFRNLEIGKGVKFKGIPYIYINKLAKVSVGNNTTINSSNYGYHINMFRRTKIVADRPKSKIIIGQNCRIHGACIHAESEIIIGDNCLIAANTQIFDSNGHTTSMFNPQERLYCRDKPASIIIGNNVWIGANCLIMKGSKIGNGSIIKAGSVVNSIVPDNVIFGGNPGVIIKTYDKSSYSPS